MKRLRHKTVDIIIKFLSPILSSFAFFFPFFLQKRDILTRTKQVRDALRIENVKLRQKCGLLGNEPLLRDYEQRKEQVQLLSEYMYASEQLYSIFTKRYFWSWFQSLWKFFMKGAKTITGLAVKESMFNWFQREQLQNTPQLIYMSLNKNSVYCVMPRSSKPPDTCKWGGPKLRGILKFSREREKRPSWRKLKRANE